MLLLIVSFKDDTFLSYNISFQSLNLPLKTREEKTWFKVGLQRNLDDNTRSFPRGHPWQGIKVPFNIVHQLPSPVPTINAVNRRYSRDRLIITSGWDTLLNFHKLSMSVDRSIIGIRFNWVSYSVELLIKLCLYDAVVHFTGKKSDFFY